MSSGEAIGDHDDQRYGSSPLPVEALTAKQQREPVALGNAQAQMPRPPEMAGPVTAQGRRLFSPLQPITPRSR